MAEAGMQEHLDALGVATRRFLLAHLPELGEDWWQKGVVTALSYQQRQIAQERDWTSLDQLDLAALLRVTLQNWDQFATKKLLPRDARSWLNEAVGIRNRVAHDAPGAPVDSRRRYRDLDTLTLLAGALNPGGPEATMLAAARDASLPMSAPVADLDPSAPASASPERPDGFTPGTMVRLIARHEVVGVVTRTAPGPHERQVFVFHDGGERSYFESQLELATEATAAALSAGQVRAGISAAQLLHPATTHLYSFNSGRIDYEPYQFRPVMKLISADRPRLLIADDVGVGKTIEAGLIVKELQARQPLESVLIICPKPLVTEGKWRAELKRFDEDFIELDSASLRYCLDETRLEGKWPARYRKAILPYSLLDERLLLGDGEGRNKRTGLTALMPPVKFDLVMVDEAHHVRNTDTWRHRVVKHLLNSAEAAVLISATPIQTGSSDLYNLLRLLRPDILVGPPEFDRMREPNAYLSRAEQAARRGGSGWQADALAELEGALGTAWGSAVMLADPKSQIARDLLEMENPTDATRVAAVRALQALNTFSGLINRTRRRDIGAFAVRKPETVTVDFSQEQEAVHTSLIDLCTRIIQTRQPSQSVEFLLSTLRRQASSSINGLAPFIGDLLAGRLSDEEASEADGESGWFSPDELSAFRTEIQAVADAAARLDADPKLDALLRVIREKQEMANNKLLLFSTFRHTLRYLLPRLHQAGVRVGLVHGGVPDDERRDIRARFAFDKSDSEAFDVLLSSEVGTEGLDNQFCDTLVNYDIPWNPMRIEQRIGRIDRRGQKSESVAIKNLVVSGTVDATIYERCLLRIGVFRESLGGSEEVLGELTREMRAIGDDLRLTPAEQDEKLRQLADNKLARIQEQSELEDREAALFGLAVQKLDDEGVEAAVSPWLTGPQLGGLVTEYLERIGYERASTLFDKAVGVFRPDKAVRSTLLADTKSLGTSGSVVTDWTQWLAGASEGQTRRFTFEPALAESDGVELLSSTHPLVRVAARAVGALVGATDVSLRADATADLPPGRYPFAVHGWTALGVRDEFEIRVLTADPTGNDAVSKALLAATSGASALTDADRQELDAVHYETWATARGEHIDRARVHIAGQLASLELSHRGRVSLLEDQIASATHPNIQRMFEGELRSAEADYEERVNELKRAADRCDVTSALLCSGVLEVQ
jgi:superfamily II DNA or RNA helicase